MNKSKLKTYAPQARRDFIAAVTARANLLGLSEKGGQLVADLLRHHSLNTTMSYAKLDTPKGMVFAQLTVPVLFPLHIYSFFPLVAIIK
ncbi:MAG: hypothetical protein Q7U78_05400 [Gallionella sp.]|nr:hypothetical protein [Gallionella sp.]